MRNTGGKTFINIFCFFFLFLYCVFFIFSSRPFLVITIYKRPLTTTKELSELIVNSMITKGKGKNNNKKIKK